MGYICLTYICYIKTKQTLLILYLIIMKTLFNYSNYGNDLKLTRKDAESVSHSGDCEADVIVLMDKQYVKKQLNLLEPKRLAKELEEYGAWDDKELNDHKANLKRFVWISGNDIVENN